MKFVIDSATALNILDNEISDLLTETYVSSGFTSIQTAKSIFLPQSVRKRGDIIAARCVDDQRFAGMVIIVTPKSSACRIANSDESEMHLLATKPNYQGYGLGKRLVSAAIDYAKQLGYSKMVLFTQTNMLTAHHLYESTGFIRQPDRDFSQNGKEFWVFEIAF